MSEATTYTGRSGDAEAKSENRGLIARIKLFFRQVIGEIKNVVAPTRKELGNLFLTVIVFVAIVMAFVGIIDILFGQLVILVFG